MPPDLPIACSLGAAELPQRLVQMSAVGRASLLAAETDATRTVLTFRPAAVEQLAAIVAAEAECCAFLTMELDEGPDGVRLTIDAPPGAEPVVQDLVAAFRSAQRAA